MATELSWLASVPASLFYAVDAMLRSQTVADRRVADTMADSVTGFSKMLSASGTPSRTLLAHLAPLAATTANTRELAQIAWTKTLGRTRAEPLITTAAQSLSELLTLFTRALPEAEAELALRAAPLREQWEARGPGLLFSIGQLTTPELLPATAQVVLVHPVQGGGGSACLAYNRVLFEAVLANPHPQLPEVVRLAWLLSMLNQDLPLFSEQIHRDRLAWLAAAAMLPAALQAAETVELAPFSPAAVEHAIVAWQLTGLVPPQESATVVKPSVLAATLWDWWETYQSSRPAWSVALRALDQMLVG